MSLPDLAPSTSWVAAATGHLPQLGGLAAAMVVAVISTTCYAASAVLQEREAGRQAVGGAVLVWRLARRPWWWLAIAASGAGAVLHIAALALGPLSLIQPIGVLTLVLALPLGARLGGRVVTRGQWRAAGAVALGLAAVLTVLPHRAPPAHLPSATVLPSVATIAVVTLVLVGLAACLPARGAAVVRAAAAATCFGFASGMARVAVTGAAPIPLATILAASGAAAGLGLAQLAYRGGGLGAPLATVILVDPLVAVVLGTTLLGEPLRLTPVRVAIAAVGLVCTVIGIGALSSPPHPPPRPGAGSMPVADEERNTADVVR